MTWLTLKLENSLRDRENVQPTEWLYLDSDNPHTQLPDYRVEVKPYMFHVFRNHWVAHRCKAIGIKPVDTIITEWGCDQLQDVQGEGDTYEHFKAKFGVYPYGFWRNKEVYSYYHPEWSHDETVFQYTKWRYENKADWEKGILGFDWGFDTGHGEDIESRGFNNGAHLDYQELLIEDSANYTHDEPTPDPEPPIEDETPMPNGTIDLLEYLRGDGRVYDVAYHFASSGAQVVQTQTDGRRFYHVKGAIGWDSQWEELWYDNDYIWRGTDCSPSLEELYQISENGEYGARWIQRFAKVGDKHLSKPTQAGSRG